MRLARSLSYFGARAGTAFYSKLALTRGRGVVRSSETIQNEDVNGLRRLLVNLWATTSPAPPYGLATALCAAREDSASPLHSGGALVSWIAVSTQTH